MNLTYCCTVFKLQCMSLCTALEYNFEKTWDVNTSQTVALLCIYTESEKQRFRLTLKTQAENILHAPPAALP